MKFVNAIYAGENTLGKLWVIVAWLAVMATLFLSSTMYLVFRDPLIIERSCVSKVVAPRSVAITKAETESFIREALSARFDTDRDKPSLLTAAQADTKLKELSELSAKNITQVVFVDKLDLRPNGEFRAKLTRLLKVGKLSTALGFEIEAKVLEASRTEDNPYGLLLSTVKPIESEVGKNE